MRGMNFLKIGGKLFGLTVTAMLLWQGISVGAAPVNMALNKPCKASSVEGANIPSKAFDGVDNTGPARGQGNRWASAYDKKINPNVDSAWLYVDLGAKTGFDSLAIKWEHSGAKKYDVQVWNSETDTPAVNDDVRWKTIYTDTSLFYEAVPVDACLRFTRVAATQARYVRIRCYKRIFNFGFSIFEFEIYNTGSPVALLPKIDHKFLPRFIQTSEHFTLQSINGSETPTSGVIYSINGEWIQNLYSANTGELSWNYQNAKDVRVQAGQYVLRVKLSAENQSVIVNVP